MKLNDALRLLAGFMVLLSAALTAYVDRNFIWLTVFVGANLLQFGFTNVCPLGTILRKLGVPDAQRSTQA